MPLGTFTGRKTTWRRPKTALNRPLSKSPTIAKSSATCPWSIDSSPLMTLKPRKQITSKVSSSPTRHVHLTCATLNHGVSNRCPSPVGSLQITLTEFCLCRCAWKRPLHELLREQRGRRAAHLGAESLQPDREADAGTQPGHVFQPCDHLRVFGAIWRGRARLQHGSLDRSESERGSQSRRHN